MPRSPWRRIPLATIAGELRFGHATVTVDAEAKDNARARADVLVRYKGQPLAIFELKRPGVKLTKDDDEQGLSYARILHPRPPLVVISNGATIRVLETESGKLWQPDTMSATLATLIERGVEVAQANLKRAVATLMGADPDIWMQAVRQAMEKAIDRLRLPLNGIELSDLQSSFEWGQVRTRRQNRMLQRSPTRATDLARRSFLCNEFSAFGSTGAGTDRIRMAESRSA